MSRPYLWFWAVWLLIGLGYELWAVWMRPGPWDTLSEFTLLLVKVNTRAGWFALMLLMGFLAAWFPAHVRKLGQDGRLDANRAE